MAAPAGCWAATRRGSRRRAWPTSGSARQRSTKVVSYLTRCLGRLPTGPERGQPHLRDRWALPPPLPPPAPAGRPLRAASPCQIQAVSSRSGGAAGELRRAHKSEKGGALETAAQRRSGCSKRCMGMSERFNTLRRALEGHYATQSGRPRHSMPSTCAVREPPLVVAPRRVAVVHQSRPLEILRSCQLELHHT